MTDEDIEIAAEWIGQPGILVPALVNVGFLDGENDCYRIHDWADHQPYIVERPQRSKAARRAAEAKWKDKTPEQRSESARHAANAKWGNRNYDASALHANSTDSASCLHAQGALDAQGMRAPYPSHTLPTPPDTTLIVKTMPNQEQDQERTCYPHATPSAPHNNADFIARLLMRNGNSYRLNVAQADLCRKLYPSVDVEQEFRNMEGWSAATPLILHTNSGAMKFVHKWLRNAQKEARPAATKRTAPELPPLVPSIPLPDGLDEQAGRQAWCAILDQIKATVQRQNFETWLKPLKGAGVCVDTKTLYVKAPASEFMHVGDKYADALNGAVTRIGLESIEFYCDVEQATPS